jgi:hypothetical protein
MSGCTHEANQAEEHQPPHDDGLNGEDPFLDKLVIIFLLVFLLAVIFIPREWFLSWSMWLNGVQ